MQQSTAERGDSIVTAGGHVYPLTENALVAYRDRFCSRDLQKQRVFQAKVDVAKKRKKIARCAKTHWKTRLSGFYRDRFVITRESQARSARR